LRIGLVALGSFQKSGAETFFSSLAASALNESRSKMASEPEDSRLGFFQ